MQRGTILGFGDDIDGHIRGVYPTPTVFRLVGEVYGSGSIGGQFDPQRRSPAYWFYFSAANLAYYFGSQ